MCFWSSWTTLPLNLSHSTPLAWMFNNNSCVLLCSFYHPCIHFWRINTLVCPANVGVFTAVKSTVCILLQVPLFLITNMSLRSTHTWCMYLVHWLTTSFNPPPWTLHFVYLFTAKRHIWFPALLLFGKPLLEAVLFPLVFLGHMGTPQAQI